MSSAVPGSYLGRLVCGMYTQEYSLELRPDGSFVLYSRMHEGQEFVPADEGTELAVLSRFCHMHGMDGLALHESLNRVNPDLAKSFWTALS
ncbi:MAG: hypothetical protein F6K39_02270 [Okeania sp. SIO3B3]|nr:hypothetical protein [Okeania sp. SIO3B3]